MARDIQAEITQRIISKLEQGVIPWKQPWGHFAGAGMPRNAVSGHAYSGSNILVLWITADENKYTKQLWLSFKQALDVGGHVRKGEKSTMIIKAGRAPKTVDGETVYYPFMKSFPVFNVDQCEGLPESITGGEPKVLNPGERDAVTDEFIAATGAAIHHLGGRAFYTPTTDSITMPAFEAFKGADAYYGTMFHEMGHWTGAKHRLDRVFGGRFGDRAYAAEELVAELTAAFLCGEFGYDNTHMTEQHAAYLKSWLRTLADHPKMLIAAASAASKAVEFMRALALKDDVAPSYTETSETNDDVGMAA